MVKNTFGKRNVDGSIILNEQRKVGREDVVWMNEIGKSGGLFKLGNDYIGFIKCTDHTCNCTLKENKGNKHNIYLHACALH